MSNFVHQSVIINFLLNIGNFSIVSVEEESLNGITNVATDNSETDGNGKIRLKMGEFFHFLGNYIQQMTKIVAFN